ncbi:UNKNOWN [Stylonychia lemnae]|uniref:Uncharacterized protein n=1 Tax=Stylonychia lemnae TaxID=5949 RepID=A0A078AIC5_STYLE|nr:UNKNOWN [Stylonychia lemnae]|eukprot:CDW81257.1 UNKNOWN [Stylonychia lemnae]
MLVETNAIQTEFQRLERSVILGSLALLHIKGIILTSYLNSNSCDQYCRIIDGFQCTSTLGQQSKCSSYCGDVNLVCYDGNLMSGDGYMCNNDCRIKSGFTLTLKNNQQEKIEQSCQKIGSICLDSNDQTGDGCDQNCQTEEDHYCINDMTTGEFKCYHRNVRIEKQKFQVLSYETTNLISLGYGQINSCTKNSDKEIEEECDDGDESHSGGCDSQCKVKEGYTCLTQFGMKSTCFQNCALFGTQCLDQNFNDNDGYVISGFLSQLGVINIAEQKPCSDLNSQSVIIDGNFQNIQIPDQNIVSYCKNGIIELGEQCDDGDMNSFEKYQFFPTYLLIDAIRIALFKMDIIKISEENIHHGQNLAKTLNLMNAQIITIILEMVVMTTVELNKVGLAQDKLASNQNVLRIVDHMDFNAWIIIILIQTDAINIAKQRKITAVSFSLT